MIIDTHIHIYDPLRPQGVPWPNPNDPVLYRQILPELYKETAFHLGITGAIVVEASPWLEDNQWVLDLAENEPFIVGFVGNLQPGSKDFREHLRRFSANPLFRGIRPRTNGLFTANSDTQAKNQFISDVEQLAVADLQLDLLIRSTELAHVAYLAESIPELRIVIDHVASATINGQNPPQDWVEGIHLVAQNPNVYCKISGLVEGAQKKPACANVQYYAPTLDLLWSAFGEDRLLYGSNWPVSEHYADYTTVYQIASAYCHAKGEQAVEKVFWQNAKAVYKWR